MKNYTSENLSVQAQKMEPVFLAHLKKNKKRLEKMDNEVHALHEEASERIECLQCANCCKSLGPAIYDRDIERLAKALRMKPSEVVKTFLRVDEDNDYVFKTMPCPFLMPDNYCSIYESRPKACREYPHTDRKNFVQIYKLTVKNTYTCPIAFDVLLNLTKL
ncbi:MAG: zinc/iron-chelating domain-containing protein [Bacteroidales bacterium 45-6]|nr:MAG: zinc/iron-chelating domain-containing protein [Bacteroidales bacterium 45-6]